MLFTDNVTFHADIGYRYLEFEGLKYNSTVTNFLGSVSKGQTASNHSGGHRKLSLSGPFVGIGFRFYLSYY